METITKKYKVFEYDELSEEAKEKVVEHFQCQDMNFWESENNATIEAFEKIFPVGRIDFEYGGSMGYIRFDFLSDNDIENLTDIRLLKYLVNNYYHSLFKGKYYGKLVDHKKDKDHPIGKEYKFIYSNCQFENSCVLTGYCMDDDILQPIYDFLKKPSSITFIELMEECLNAWLSACTREYEHSYSEEGIKDHVESNEYKFLEDGEIFNG